MKVVTCVLTIALVVGFVIVLNSHGQEPIPDNLSHGQMTRIVGGANYIHCDNQCANDSSCGGTCSQGTADDGEDCGTEGGSGAVAWACIAGGSTQNCSAWGNNSSCSAHPCKCKNGKCNPQSGSTTVYGSSSCSDN